MGLRPFGPRTVRMKRSKNAHSSSDIRSRAKRVSIADTSLNHDQPDLRIPVVNTSEAFAGTLAGPNA